MSVFMKQTLREHLNTKMPTLENCQINLERILKTYSLCAAFERGQEIFYEKHAKGGDQSSIPEAVLLTQVCWGLMPDLREASHIGLSLFLKQIYLLLYTKLLYTCIYVSSISKFWWNQTAVNVLDLWDITFCTCIFWGPKLSSIGQTAPADPNS